MKLLIADDNPDVIDTLKSYFSVRGFEVKAVTDGLDCMVVVQDFKPDFILLDIKMKRIDGDKIIPDLLVMAPGVRILVISGSQDASLRHKVLQLGAHDYFEKPVPVVKIAAAMKRTHQSEIPQ